MPPCRPFTAGRFLQSTYPSHRSTSRAPSSCAHKNRQINTDSNKTRTAASAPRRSTDRSTHHGAACLSALHQAAACVCVCELSKPETLDELRRPFRKTRAQGSAVCCV